MGGINVTRFGVTSLRLGTGFCGAGSRLPTGCRTFRTRLVTVARVPAGLVWGSRVARCAGGAWAEGPIPTEWASFVAFLLEQLHLIFGVLRDAVGGAYGYGGPVDLVYVAAYGCVGAHSDVFAGELHVVLSVRQRDQY